MTEPVTQVAIPAAVPPAAVGFLDEVRHAGLDLQGQQSTGRAVRAMALR